MVEMETDQVVDLEKVAARAAASVVVKEVVGDLVEMEDLMVEQAAEKAVVVIMAELMVAELMVD